MPETSSPRHCWMGLIESVEFGSPAWVDASLTGDATCLLPDGHEGPHEWTPDAEIQVRFRVTPMRPETDFVAALARKWGRGTCPLPLCRTLTCLHVEDRVVAAISEALEEVEKMTLAARDLDGPHEGKQLDCTCDLKIVTHLKAWNAACKQVAAAIRALREGH